MTHPSFSLIRSFVPSLFFSADFLSDHTLEFSRLVPQNMFRSDDEREKPNTKINRLRFLRS